MTSESPNESEKSLAETIAAQERQKLIDAAVEQLGPETVNHLLDSAREIEAAVIRGAMHSKNEGKSSENFPNLVRDFANNLYGRYTSVGVSPAPVENALKEAIEKISLG